MRDETGNAETEIKLRMTEAQARRLRCSAWWRALDDGGRTMLRSAYFDTPNRDLRRLSLALRTRNNDDRLEQTLKMAGAGGALVRREWTAAIAGDAPDPGRFAASELPDDYRSQSASDLAPVFRLSVNRETRRLKRQDADIEIAIDEGAVEAGALTAPVNEIELELHSGAPDALIETARRVLNVAGGRAFLRSKADRGYDLADGREIHWSKPGKFSLDREMSAAEALQAIALQCLEHLTSNDDCARTRAHIEGVHQCRIACRQARSAFRIFRPLLPEVPFAALRDEARRIARALARARDLDVMETELLIPAKETLGATDMVDRLFAELLAQRMKAYAKAALALSDRRYEQFLVDLLAVAMIDDWADGGDRRSLREPATLFAAAALDKAYDRLRKRGKGFKDLSADDRHRLRISVKRMRYACGFFAALFDADETRRFRKLLSGLQDRLGALNDVVVAKKSLHALVRRAAKRDDDVSDLAAEADRVLDWRRRDIAALKDALINDWNAFETAEPFWRS